MLTFSQGVVNAVAMGQGWGDIIRNAVVVVYSGSKPVAPETAASGGTELVRFTTASGALTAETRAACKIVLAGGTVGSDKVNIGMNIGASAVVSITGGDVAWTTNLATTMQAVITAINSNWTYPDFYAVVGGTVVGGVTYGAANAGEFYLIAPKNSGTVFNTATITCANTTITAAVNGGSATTTGTGTFGSGTGSTAGVACVNGLTMTYPPSAGQINKAGVWSGTASATGTAGWFRIICTPCYDTGLTNLSSSSDDSKLIQRIDGTIGTSGADMLVSSATITNAVSQTVTTFSMTVPAA